jgi:hypothetical protein
VDELDKFNSIYSEDVVIELDEFSFNEAFELLGISFDPLLVDINEVLAEVDSLSSDFLLVLDLEGK